MSKQKISRIFGRRFYYDKITYKELLDNDQIIKYNMDCKEYYKSCSIIDTLNQKLCIREEENCPLYDIVIGRQPYNLKDYIYDKEANLYYNNENYKGNTIIGKLILNDGEPCYYLDDKL